jgi:hypothetical protein
LACDEGLSIRASTKAMITACEDATFEIS